MTTLAQIIAQFDPSSELVVPPDWFQGRTVYGGLSTALALQSVLRSTTAELPPLKSAHVAFIGPAAGALGFQSQALRQGKSVTSLSVDCLSGGELALRTVMFFAHPRPSQIRHDFSKRPDVQGPDAYKTLKNQDSTPPFIHNFEMRPAGGSMPLSGASNPEFLIWVRHVDATGVDPSVALVALADALPPATMATLPRIAPMSSITWTIDFPQPAPAGEWFLLRSFSQQAQDGYSFQDMEIWDESGRRVLWGRQSVAVFA